MDINEIKVLLAIYAGNEKLALKNAGGKKLAGSSDYFIVTDDGICHLFDANGTEKDVSAITTLTEDIVSKDIKKIVIPSCVTHIRGETFSDCSRLTSVTIPDSVACIDVFAFARCSSLMNVVIPDSMTTIKSYVFYKCDRLTSVTMPDSVTCIDNYAFERCTGLMSVTIPDSVTNIGKDAFYGCKKLTSVMIGSTVTAIGWRAFSGCSNLKLVVFKGKTLDKVKAMKNYPFGIEDESAIKCIDEMHTVA